MEAHVSIEPASPRRSAWTDREAELLAVTLGLLQEHGYDRLTVEAVAARGEGEQGHDVSAVAVEGGSGAGGVHRGHPKCDGCAAHRFAARRPTRHSAAAVCRQSREHASTMRAVLNEMSHSPQLRLAMQAEFVHQRKR